MRGFSGQQRTCGGYADAKSRERAWSVGNGDQLNRLGAVTMLLENVTRWTASEAAVLSFPVD